MIFLYFPYSPLIPRARENSVRSLYVVIKYPEIRSEFGWGVARPRPHLFGGCDPLGKAPFGGDDLSVKWIGV